MTSVCTWEGSLHLGLFLPPPLVIEASPLSSHLLADEASPALQQFQGTSCRHQLLLATRGMEGRRKLANNGLRREDSEVAHLLLEVLRNCLLIPGHQRARMGVFRQDNHHDRTRSQMQDFA